MEVKNFPQTMDRKKDTADRGKVSIPYLQAGGSQNLLCRCPVKSILADRWLRPTRPLRGAMTTGTERLRAGRRKKPTAGQAPTLNGVRAHCVRARKVTQGLSQDPKP